MHRKVLLENLVQKGIMGTERNSSPDLAAFLSEHRDRYAPDGRGNFSRIVWRLTSRPLRRRTVRVLRGWGTLPQTAPARNPSM